MYLSQEPFCYPYLQLSATENAKTYKAELILNIAKPSEGGSGFNDNLGVITPVDARSLDAKIDDGVARTGTVKAYLGYDDSESCLTGEDGNYLVTQTTSPMCALEFILKK